MMKIFQNYNRYQKCPACDAEHEVVTPFKTIDVMICSLIADLIYVGNTQIKEVRKRVKEELFGL